jgi:glutaredoxin 2
MRLYMFEHCSLCFRVRMTAALKHMHLQEVALLDDDSDALIRLVGKRQIPVLVKDDGQPMLESMEMVKYIDAIGEPALIGPERPEVADWADRAAQKTAPLTWPRYPLLGLPEFATVAALDHYTMRKRNTLGDFVEHRAKTRDYLRELTPHLEQLDGLIESPRAINGQLSIDDIRVLPLLRSAAVVKGLRFPEKVRGYFEMMMARIGYQPLPAI